MDMKTLLKQIYIMVLLIALTFAMKVHFQFQCYGERILCNFPEEYCSSEVRKCIICSPAICSNKGKIPLGCYYACNGDEESGEYSYMVPFICVATLATVLGLIVLYLAWRAKIIRCCDSGDPENGGEGYSSVPTSANTSTDHSPALSTKSKHVRQPCSVEGRTASSECYGEQKLKNITPVQNQHEAYKPTTSQARLEPESATTEEKERLTGVTKC